LILLRRFHPLCPFSGSRMAFLQGRRTTAAEIDTAAGKKMLPPSARANAGSRRGECSACVSDGAAPGRAVASPRTRHLLRFALSVRPLRPCVIPGRHAVAATRRSILALLLEAISHAAD